MAAWRESEKLAAQILTGQVPLRNATGGATNFHAVSVTPDWADTWTRPPRSATTSSIAATHTHAS